VIESDIRSFVSIPYLELTPSSQLLRLESRFPRENYAVKYFVRQTRMLASTFSNKYVASRERQTHPIQCKQLLTGNVFIRKCWSQHTCLTDEIFYRIVFSWKSAFESKQLGRRCQFKIRDTYKRPDVRFYHQLSVFYLNLSIQLNLHLPSCAFLLSSIIK
jgi:hypothetical protein